jgi:hypothetical protein
MNINEVEEELLFWKKEDICNLIVNLMDNGKLDITDINLCYSRSLEARIAEKDRVIFDADTLLFESLFNDSIGKTSDAKQMMKKVKWMEERGTHNMDGIMEFLLKDSKKPVKTERKRTRK